MARQPAFIVLFLIFISSNARADTTAFSPQGFSAYKVDMRSYQGGQNSAGYRFGVSRPIRIRRYGFFDDFTDGQGLIGTPFVEILTAGNQPLRSQSLPNNGQVIGPQYTGSGFVGAFRYSSRVSDSAALLLTPGAYLINGIGSNGSMTAGWSNAGAASGVNQQGAFIGRNNFLTTSQPSFGPGLFGPNFIFDYDQRPTIQLSGNSGAVTDGGSTRLQWLARDDFQLRSTNARLYRNGSLRSSSSSSNSLFNLDSYGLGSFVLEVVTTDRANQSTTQSRRVTIVDDDSSNPTVGIAGIDLENGDSTIDFTAQDASGLSSVELVVTKDGTEIYANAFGAGFSDFSFDISSFGAGSFNASITATDADLDWSGDSLSSSTSQTFVVAVPEPSSPIALVTILGIMACRRKSR